MPFIQLLPRLSLVVLLVKMSPPVSHSHLGDCGPARMFALSEQPAGAVEVERGVEPASVDAG